MSCSVGRCRIFINGLARAVNPCYNNLSMRVTASQFHRKRNEIYNREQFECSHESRVQWYNIHCIWSDGLAIRPVREESSLKLASSDHFLFCGGRLRLGWRKSRHLARHDLQAIKKRRRWVIIVSWTNPLSNERLQSALVDKVGRW